MKRFGLALCLFLSGSLIALCKEILTGRVIKVSDGDTITILTEDFAQIKVRLHGVDCPEHKQDFGNKAKIFTSELVFGKVVRVVALSKDRYGRTIGIVSLPDGRVLNTELLKAGLAWHYKKYDKSDEWADLEIDARKRKVGLWSMKNPIAPWEQRKIKQKR
jgi:endonuclease YncB( thermonuclease family)